MTIDDYEFKRPNPLEPDKKAALGHIMLTGRADLAALAMNPGEASAEDVRRHATGAARSMPAEERELFLDSVAEVFPQVNQRTN